jgi:SAM-dependent methyltransferase
MQTEQTYLLGISPAEVQRLERQSERLAEPTRLLLERSGLKRGMRVLDLGTGIGDVAFLAAELVGPEGSVLGLDQAAEALRVAEHRRAQRGLDQVRFIEGDVSTFRDARPFDAVVGRLILLHVADPLAVVRHHAASLVPGGLFVAIDYDCGALRAEPPTPLVTQACGWVLEGFRLGGADPVVGARLRTLLGHAGLAGVDALGLQDYAAPGDPYGPAALTAVVRALLPVITRAGLATAEEIAIDTLAQRVDAEVRAASATLMPPTLACAWGARA